MIASLIAKIGLPAWAVNLFAGVVVVAALAGAGILEYRHIYNAGVKQEQAAQRVRDRENERLATAALAVINARVAAVQAQLTLARAEVQKLEKENEIEKANSDDLQRRLIVGEQRMRVLVRAAAPGSAGPDQGAGAVAVDPGAAVEADLDATVAANLEWLRSTRDRAIGRLGACIAEYDALKAAVDSTRQ